MCGGGPSYPAPPSPEEEANAQIRIEQERAAREQAEAEAQRQREAAEEATRRRQFDTNLEAARGTALTDAQGLLQSMFATRPDLAAQFSESIRGDVQRAARNVPDLAPNPGNYFDAQALVDTLVTRERQQRQAGALRDVDAFAGQGFALDRLPGSADDDIIANILGEEYDRALQPITRSFQRGLLDELGYNAAVGDLDSQRSVAEGRLQDIGGGLLENTRTDLRGIADEARGRASTLDLLDTFDPSVYSSRIDTTLSDALANLGGRIRSGIGETPLFSDAAAITRGGVTQGVRNPGSEGVAGIAETIEDRRRRENERRGLGTQGAF